MFGARSPVASKLTASSLSSVFSVVKNEYETNEVQDSASSAPLR